MVENCDCVRLENIMEKQHTQTETLTSRVVSLLLTASWYQTYKLLGLGQNLLAGILNIFGSTDDGDH